MAHDRTVVYTVGHSNHPIERFVELQKTLGLSRAVLVNASCHGVDNTVILDAIAQSGGPGLLLSYRLPLSNAGAMRHPGSSGPGPCEAKN